MKYIVYKGTGGLFHNLWGLTQAIRVAKKCNHALIIDMQCHKPFGGKFSDFFELKNTHIKWCDTYDIMPEELVEDYKDKRAKAFGYLPDKTSPEYLSSIYTIDANKDVNVFFGPSEITNKSGISKHIKVNSTIHDMIATDNIVLQNKKYIAVHFRNTDIKNTIDFFYDKIQTVTLKYNIQTIYLATDDYYCKNMMETKFPNLEFIQKVNPSKDVHNIHYHHDNPWQQMYECLQDAYNILQSDIFIPSLNSSYSRAIIRMMKRKETFFPGVVSDTTLID